MTFCDCLSDGEEEESAVLAGTIVVGNESKHCVFLSVVHFDLTPNAHELYSSAMRIRQRSGLQYKQVQQHSYLWKASNTLIVGDAIAHIGSKGAVATA